MEKPFSFGLPQNQNFCEFVYYENALMPHEVDKVKGLWKESEAIKAGLAGTDELKDELRKTTILGIENFPENQWLYERLGQIGIQINNERYGFEILGFHEALQLMHYGLDDLFDWHLDFGPGTASGRKLSMTVQLSDSEDYEGGDLEFRINSEIVKAPRAKGTVVIFPSFIMHRVTPITKGERKSIVGWIGGPPYR